MGDYLTNLVMRCFNSSDTIRPRPNGLFEPTSPAVAMPFTRQPEESAFNEELEQAEATSETSTRVYPQENDLATVSQPAIRVQDATQGNWSNNDPGRSPPAVIQPLKPDTQTNQVLAGPDRSNRTMPQPHDAIRPPPQSPKDYKPSTTAMPVKDFSTKPFDNSRTTVEEMETSTVVETQEASPGNPDNSATPKTFRLKNGTADPPITEKIVARPHVVNYEKNSEVVSNFDMTLKDRPSSVNVTIGRVEVRAIMPDSKPAERPGAKKPGPSLSLDEYLKRRNEERR